MRASARVLNALAVTALLAGCSTRPVIDAEATPVQPDKVLAVEMTRARPGTYPLTIKRDSGLAAGACSTRVFVNGAPVADIRPTEKVVVYLPAGEHMLAARANGICGGGLVETRVGLRAGVPQAVRVGYGTSGDFFIVPTAF